MAVDRNLKQKRKREEARKKIAQERERISQREKIDDYKYQLSDESRQKNWGNVLRYAQKGLNLAPSDRVFFDYACLAASGLKDDVTLLKLLTQGWPLNLVNHPANALILADLIFQYQTKMSIFFRKCSQPFSMSASGSSAR